MRARRSEAEPDCRNVGGAAAALSGIILWAAAFVLAGVTTVRAQNSLCDAPAAPMQQIELLFGRLIDTRSGGSSGTRAQVGATAWSRFLAREVTPRFPDGLSVVDAAGQWRDHAGRVVREPSKLVFIVTADRAAADKIAAIVSAYKQRFHQRSVGVVTRPVCAAF